MGHLQHAATGDRSSGQVLNRSLLCFKNDNSKLVLEAGCEVFNPDFENKTFIVGDTQYTTSPEFNDTYISTTDSLADSAMKYINSPYIWGGRIPSGIDCSGLTQLVYKIKGIPLPRDSCSRQRQAGVWILLIRLNLATLFFLITTGNNITCGNDLIERFGYTCFRKGTDRFHRSPGDL